MSIAITEVAVAGGGPVGLATALAFAGRGFHVALIAPLQEPTNGDIDQRTTALIGSSIEFLKNLGVWPMCAPQAAPIAAVRIADDLAGLVRSPEVLFRASEIGLSEFGANIANPVLHAALHAAADRALHITRIANKVVAISQDGANVRLKLANGHDVAAPLLAAADGRASLAPAAAGIAVRSWQYPQAAVATSFAHSQPHYDTVNELHRRAGPLTTVPMPGNRSSLVWAETPEEAERIATLDDRGFRDLLEERLCGLLGSVGEITPRAIHPLSGLTATRMGASRIALVGEAAHVVPPIGAQGLNLGLRDAATLVHCASRGRAQGHDPGSPEVIAAYEKARSTDVFARSLSIDLLNRSLLAALLPVEVARSLALHAVSGLQPLRRLLMEVGMGSSSPLPELMRPNALSPSL
jgi:2-octaprenyl-6-methoxyphenol hydroxylase